MSNGLARSDMNESCRQSLSNQIHHHHHHSFSLFRFIISQPVKKRCNPTTLSKNKPTLCAVQTNYFVTKTNHNPMNGTSSPPTITNKTKNSSSSSSSNLSKKEKGRLKKLHSKSSLPKNNNNAVALTGIQSNDEANEYKLLCTKKKNKSNNQNHLRNGSSSSSNHQQQQQNEIKKKTTSTEEDSFIPNGPSIRFRKVQKQEKTTRLTEGDDHRNLLHGILFHIDSNNNHENQSSSKKKQGKKRKRVNNNDKDDEEVSATPISSSPTTTTPTPTPNHEQENHKKDHKQQHHIPSWATIHNPALIQNFIVLEFHLQTKQQKTNATTNANNGHHDDDIYDDLNYQTDPILVNSEILSKLHGNHQNNDNTKDTTSTLDGIYTKVRLFQENFNNNTNTNKMTKQKEQRQQRPRDVTSVLMYSEKKYKKVVTHQDQNKVKIDDANNDDNDQVLSAKKKQKMNHQDEHYNNIFTRLENVILSEKEMVKEGYPMMINDCTINSNENNSTSEQINEEKDLYNENEVKDKIKNVGEKMQDYIDEQRQRSMNGCCSSKENGIGNNGTKKFPLEDFTSSIFSPNEASKIVTSLHRQYMRPTNMKDKDVMSDQSLKDCDIIIDERLFVPTFLDAPTNDDETLSYIPKVYALDCEMVKTKIGSELARVSLVKLDPTKDDPERCVILLDSYVKPKNYVLDYLTEYSGITPALLYGKTKSLEQIQTILISLIRKEDILVGHSLENDLYALRIIHEKIVDTALLFRNENDSRKYSLKHLSLCLLQQRIQEGTDKKGHDSVEDAVASLTLAVRRVRLGKENFRIYDKRNNKENLMEVLTKMKRKDIISQPLFFQRNQGPMICLGPNDWIKEHVGGKNQSSANVLQCENISSSSIKALTSYLRPGSRNASFMWAKICLESKNETQLKQIDTLLAQILHVSSSTSVFLVTVQKGYDKAKSLHKQRNIARDPRCTLGWNESQDKALNAAFESSRYCDAYWITGSMYK